MDLKRNKVYYLSAAGAYKWKEEIRAGDRFELHLGRYDDFVHLIWYPQRQDGRGVPSGDGGGQQRCPIDACTVGSHVPLERFDAHRGKGRTYRHHQQNPESHHQVDFPGDGSQKMCIRDSYEAEERNQNFGQVNNAFVRIYNEQTGEELLRYDLGEDFSVETAAVFGELYKNNGEWKFNAIGSGFYGGLSALCANYGVEVE